VKQYKLESNISFLGLVDYAIVKALMHKSLAVINPSLFEGWSTTVEEAKGVGKKVLLSNIPVHQEQKPERSYYFDPKRPEELAKLLLQIPGEYSSDEEKASRFRAFETQKQKYLEFGIQYQNILLEMIRSH